MHFLCPISSFMSPYNKIAHNLCKMYFVGPKLPLTAIQNKVKSHVTQDSWFRTLNTLGPTISGGGEALTMQQAEQT
jgi:hypothetical protein